MPIFEIINLFVGLLMILGSLGPADDTKAQPVNPTNNDHAPSVVEEG